VGKDLEPAEQAGLSVAEAAAAHDATSSGVPFVAAVPVQTGICQECGEKIRSCTGHVSSADIKCAGWVHWNGRHLWFTSFGVSHLAEPGRELVRRSVALVGSAPPKRPELSRKTEDDWAAGFVRWCVKMGIGGVVFVAVMVWLNLTHVI
jgi:hypothetical protein